MKFFNKLIFILAISATILSCDPLDDIYAELDEAEQADGPDTGKTIEYTLLEEDYTALASSIRARATVADSAKADFVASNQAFTADIPAKDLLVDYVNDNYGQFLKGAAVKITYNLLDGTEEAIEATNDIYINAPNYELEAADYTAASAEAGSAGFFNTDFDMNSILPGILANEIQDASDGDIASATYNFADISYASLSGETIFEEGFASDLSSFVGTSVVGDDQSWRWSSFGGATYAQMSGFSGGSVPNEDWLVSPEIDLSSNDGDITLFITQILNFQGDAQWGEDMQILFSTDYSGDAATATWTNVTGNLTNLPEGNNYDEVSDEVTLTGASGEKIHLGFYYKSTADYSSLWRLVNLRVEAGSAPDTDEVNALYEYDGSEWSSIEDEAFFLGSLDYDAMGEGSGQPGRFNNFSSSTPPEDYLPTFLESKIQFAQEGDEYVMVYRYFSGGTSTRADTYKYSSGSWTPVTLDAFIAPFTEQYVHNGTGFIFDPSVVIEMGSDEYQAIVDVVKGTNPDLVNSFESGEDLYGADAFFENFDIRLSSKTGQAIYEGLSVDEQNDLALAQAVLGVEVYLESVFSGESPVEGVDVFYTIQFKTFDGTDAFWQVVYQLTATGEFELVVEVEKL
ncbi:MAG: choice-of-anchor J domain-containing protein [Ekhidna sp.]